MRTDSATTAVRARARGLPLPTAAPLGRLEDVAWLLLHRAAPFDRALVAHLARSWGLSLPPALQAAPPEPAVAHREPLALRRLARLVQASPPPTPLLQAVDLARAAPQLTEAGLRQALLAAGLAQGAAGGRLLRALAGLYRLPGAARVVWPSPGQEQRLEALLRRVRLAGAAPVPPSVTAAEQEWLRQRSRAAMTAGHFVRTRDAESYLAVAVRRQIAAAGPLPGGVLVTGVHRHRPAARDVDGAAVLAWATQQHDLHIDGEMLEMRDGADRWLLASDRAVLAALADRRELERSEILRVLQGHGLTAGSSELWLVRCSWLRPGGTRGRYRLAA